MAPSGGKWLPRCSYPGENLAAMGRNCCLKCRLWALRARAHGRAWQWGHLETGASQTPTQLPALSGDRTMALTEPLKAGWAAQKGSGYHWAFPFPPPALPLYGGCAALPRDRKWFVCTWWLVWLVGLLSGTQWWRMTHLTLCRKSLVSGWLCSFSWNSQNPSF